ncbi:hypothetical protein KC963_02320 [Candidatus Saccharibacteria bacterium]|nr:hypothetical protein [Candidatus Saccharibacteria bacterium]
MKEYNPEGELGLPVFASNDWEVLDYVYDCLFYHDQFGPEDMATKRLARHMDKMDTGHVTRAFKLVGHRAMEICLIIEKDRFCNNPVGTLAESLTGDLPDYLHTQHKPTITAA